MSNYPEPEDFENERRRARDEQADGVKPLDLSNVLRHAFLSGVVEGRRVPAHEGINGPKLWLDYEPYESGSYNRILSALTMTPNPKEAVCVEVREGYGFECWYGATLIDGEHHVRNATVSEALTTRTVEDVRNEAIGQALRSANEQIKKDEARIRREAFEEAKKVIADLPTGCSEDVMRGQEDAYRAVEALYPAPSRETHPYPEPVAWQARLKGTEWKDGAVIDDIEPTAENNVDYRPLFATPQPDELREPKVVTIGYHADELRQAKRDAFTLGNRLTEKAVWDRHGKTAPVVPNPYAAPDEGSKK